MRSQKTKVDKDSQSKPIDSLQSSSAPGAADVEYLQQMFGNQTLQQLFQSRHIQAKLAVGQSNDQYEQEADSVAEEIVSMPDPFVSQRNQTNAFNQAPAIRSCCGNGERVVLSQTVQKTQEPKAPPIKAKEISGKSLEVASDLEYRINNLRGKGQPLSAQARNFFEPRFNYDFSHVRIHSDSTADGLAKTVNARAFTFAQNVVFAAGEYDSNSISGKRLLAHELTHVVQQQSADYPQIQRQEKGEPIFFEEQGLKSVELIISDKVPDKNLNEAELNIKTNTKNFVIKGVVIFEPPLRSGQGVIDLDVDQGLKVWGPIVHGWLVITNYFVNRDRYFLMYPKESDATLYNELKKYVAKNALNSFSIKNEVSNKVDSIKDDEKSESNNHKEESSPEIHGWGDLSNWFKDVQLLVKGKRKTPPFGGLFAESPPDLAHTPDKIQFIKHQRDKGQEFIEIKKNGAFPSGFNADSYKHYGEDKFKEEAAKFYFEKIKKYSFRLSKSSAANKEDKVGGVTTGPVGEVKYSGGFTSKLSDDGEKTYLLPPVPAEIKGNDPQILKGTGIFQMKLLWSYIGGNLLHQVTEAMARKEYRWEAWDVTNAYNAQSNKLLGSAEIKSGEIPGGSVGKDVGRIEHVPKDFERAVQELKADADTIDKDQKAALDEGRYLDAFANEVSQNLTGLKIATTLGGQILGAAAESFGTDRERSIYWGQPGIFLIRCITNIKNSDGEQIYAPSIATKIIKVQDVSQASTEALDKPHIELAKLELQLAFLKLQSEGIENREQIKQLEERIGDLKSYTSGNFYLLLQNKKKKLIEQKQQIESDYKDMLSHGIGKSRVSRIENQITDIDKQLDRLKKDGVDNAELKKRGINIHSAEAVLVSDVTGQQYPLLIQMTEPVSRGFSYYCRLLDVTTASKSKYIYEEYADSKKEVLEKVLKDFTSHVAAEYGGGFITIRFPKVGWYKKQTKYRGRIYQEKIRTRDWQAAKENLTRLAEAIAVAGLFVANPGLAIAGAAISAGLAAERIISRIANGTFALDMQTIEDIVDVISAATLFFGKAAKGIQRIGKLGYYERNGKFFLLTEKQIQSLGNLADIADDVLDATSEIIGSTQLLDEFIKIQEAQTKEGMSAAEARQKYMSLLKNALTSARGISLKIKNTGPRVEKSKSDVSDMFKSEEHLVNKTSEYKQEIDQAANQSKAKYKPEVFLNESLEGNTVRAVPRNGKVVVEYAPGVKGDTGKILVRQHVKLAIELQKYQGFLGQIRSMIDLVTYLITKEGPARYGTKHFQAHSEIVKLKGINEALMALHTEIGNRLTTNIHKPQSLDEIKAMVVEYEKQIRKHQLDIGNHETAISKEIYSGNTIPGASASNPLRKGSRDFYKDPDIGETRYYEDEKGRVSRTTRISEDVFELEAILPASAGERGGYESKIALQAGMERAHVLAPGRFGVESPQAIANASIFVNQKIQNTLIESGVQTIRENQASDAEIRLVVRVRRKKKDGKFFLAAASYKLYASRPGLRERTIFSMEVSINDPFDVNPADSDVQIDTHLISSPDPYLHDKSSDSQTPLTRQYNPRTDKDFLKADLAREYIAHVYQILAYLKSMYSDTVRGAYARLYRKFLRQDLNAIHRDRNKQSTKLSRDQMKNITDTINERVFQEFPELRNNPNYRYYFDNKNIDDFIEY